MNDLDRRFLHHPPSSPAVAQSHDFTRRTFLALARILQQLPESRERSDAMKSLEVSSFWAHAAIARGQVAYPAVVNALAAQAATAAAPTPATDAPDAEAPTVEEPVAQEQGTASPTVG